MKTTKEYLDEAINNSNLNNDDPEIVLLKTMQAERTVSALASVINFIITDAFNLTSEESIWAGMVLGQTLQPLKEIIPSATLGAVQQEIQNGTYSLRMFERSGNKSMATDAVFITTADVKRGSVDDWTEGICQIILSSYPSLRPTLTSRIVGSIHGMFLELGVTANPKKSRVSSYLPNSIRHVLNDN